MRARPRIAWDRPRGWSGLQRWSIRPQTRRAGVDPPPPWLLLASKRGLFGGSQHDVSRGRHAKMRLCECHGGKYFTYLEYRHANRPRTHTAAHYRKRRRHHAPYTVMKSGHFEDCQRAPNARNVERRLPATILDLYTSRGGLGSRWLGAERLLIGSFRS